MANFYAEYPPKGAGGGVTSLDGLTGAITLVAGTGISIVDGVSTITISSTSAGDVTLTPVGSSPNANGASLAAQALTLQPANTSFPGVLLAADWNTFNGKQNALTFGDLTDAGTDGIVVTGGTGAVVGAGTSIAQHVSDSTHNGYLSSTDWSTFNGKQASGNYITALTGDATAAGPGSVALTLATVNANVGTFASVTINAKGLATAAAALSGDATTSGSALTLATVNSNVGSFGGATTSGTFTVNGKGLITAASSTAIQIAESQVTNLVSDLAGKQAIGNYITALTGDATAAGPGSSALTLATVNSNVGTFVSTTVNAKGLVTAASNLTGDITSSGAATTLATVNSNVGSFTNASITVNAKGLVTAASTGTTVPSISVTAIQTSNYSIQSTDGLVPASTNGGSTFTLTLPTAVGISGTIIRTKRTNSQNQHPINIATTSAQAIDADLQSYAMQTQNEEFAFCSNGTNWYVLEHIVPAYWIAYTPTYTGFGTTSNNSTFYRRVGDSVEIHCVFTTGTCTAVTAQVSLPSGLAMDTGKLATNTLVGFGSANATSQTYNVLVNTGDTTNIRFANPANGTALNGQNASAMFANATTQSFFCTVPISGWVG